MTFETIAKAVGGRKAAALRTFEPQRFLCVPKTQTRT
jgi:hypothetical protein